MRGHHQLRQVGFGLHVLDRATVLDHRGDQFIGDVRDEHDEREAPASQRLGVNSWMVSGQLRADEIRDVTGFRMPDGDYETIAGLILERLGKIPSPDDWTDVDGWRLTVTAMDRHRIAELNVHRLEEAV